MPNSRQVDVPYSANKQRAISLSRRGVLQVGAAVVGGMVLPAMPRVFAADHPPIGTWPAGAEGPTVTIGASVPRTGPYAVQGEDELKGMQLAVEHINSGHPLISKIAPKVQNGLLGKQVALVVADSAAKPNEAVQAQQRFINENKIVAMTGATSSAVAVALNKFAEREKVIYLVAISGSNDTTGKDCSRYSFRQCFYGETAANAIGPVLVKTFGKGKKAAFMTPDYTYGHTVTKSVNDYLTGNGGWTMVTNQVSPLGTQDFSQYLTNIANSGADVIVNVNWGRDAVLSIQQAKQFGLIPRMKLVIPYQIPFLAKEVGPELTEGVFAATDFWWTLQDKFPLAKMFVEAFDKKYGYKPEWGANNAYMQFAVWARMVSEAGSFYPPDIIRTYEKGETFPSTVGDVHFRAADHQLVRPVVIVRGKQPSQMQGDQDYWDVVEVVPGESLMQKPDAFGCHLGDYT
ncbi:substrate-binding protein [Bradyrhizobium sp. ORS 375]|uniref:substrate-binding protein n=1 Tax=Bradyrhizobium sp. (strain ORS 375) TaxID=566679 RepID=UPI00054DE92E